jgi:hypothetical protein
MYKPRRGRRSTSSPATASSATTISAKGRYEESERVIQQLLGVRERELVRVLGEGDEAAADWERLNSPETYLGYERTDSFASPGGVGLGGSRVFAAPGELKLNQWALSGNWTIRARHTAQTSPATAAAFSPPIGSTSSSACGKPMKRAPWYGWDMADIAVIVPLTKVSPGDVESSRCVTVSPTGPMIVVRSYRSSGVVF